MLSEKYVNVIKNPIVVIYFGRLKLHSNDSIFSFISSNSFLQSLKLHIQNNILL